MRNGSLWSNVVLVVKVFFHEFDFETSTLEFEVSKSSIWKHTTLCDKGVFSFIIISRLRWPIELNFSQVFYFVHMLRYTKWEDWSLTIDQSIKLRPIAYWPIIVQQRSDTKVRHACAYLGARGRVVQKGVGEPHLFLVTRASWAEPTGSVYYQ